MTSMRLFPILAFFICQGLVAQIGSKVPQHNTMHGAWYNNDYGFQMTLMLNPDGTGEFDGEPLKYKVEGNKINITQSGELITYSYLSQGQSLTLSGGDLEAPLTFTKNMNGGDSRVTEQSSQNYGATYSEQVITQPSADLTGIWSAGSESIEFKPNGQCVYLGQSYPYKLSPGQVTLTTIEGDIAFGYAVIGDDLSLSYNQNIIKYTRGSGNAVGHQNQNSGSGRVDNDLVGKWCYVDVSNVYGSSSSSSSTCITLNADGTYQYYGETSRSVNTPDYYGGTNSQSSDQGTWYVQGDRIYYNSQTQGPGSYKLEKRNHPKNVNDPMIILDGTAYVTAYQKAPWR